MTSHIDVSQLSEFSPFDALKIDNLSNFLEHVEMLQASPGEVLFKKGDPDKRSIYLLNGVIDLTGDDTGQRRITGGTSEAKFPIAPGLPRQESALAATDVRCFTIDRDLLDVAVTLDQTGVYEVGDFRSDINVSNGDWMTALLRNAVFQQLPPQCLQMIFMRLQRVDFKAGDVVIQQGSSSDYFYVIRSGRCLVTRESASGKDDIGLAELDVGATFGEESIISESNRNATVRMLSDGILMRLSRDDFDVLLKEPMLTTLEHDEAREAAAHGGQWLDVRVPSEVQKDGIKGATNLPLYVLRHKLDTLDRRTPYIVYCDTGRRSSAAAFVLSQNGFEVAVLKGGLMKTDQATGTVLDTMSRPT